MSSHEGTIQVLIVNSGNNDPFSHSGWCGILACRYTKKFEVTRTMSTRKTDYAQKAIDAMPAQQRQDFYEHIKDVQRKDVPTTHLLYFDTAGIYTSVSTKSQIGRLNRIKPIPKEIKQLSRKEAGVAQMNAAESCTHETAEWKEDRIMRELHAEFGPPPPSSSTSTPPIMDAPTQEDPVETFTMDLSLIPKDLLYFRNLWRKELFKNESKRGHSVEDDHNATSSDSYDSQYRWLLLNALFQ